MDEHPERRRYNPDGADSSLSEAVLEAVEAHENASLAADEFPLYEHVSPDAIDALFADTSEVAITLQVRLENVSVSVWNDGAIDIRVVDSAD